MAITQAVTEWEGIVGKNFDAQSLISQARKLLIYKVTVTYDGSQNYVTGGNLVDLLARGAKTIVTAMCTRSSKGFVVSYIPSTGAIQLFGVDPAAAGGAIVAFPELPSASTETQSLVLEFLVYAQR